MVKIPKEIEDEAIRRYIDRLDHETVLKLTGNHSSHESLKEQQECFEYVPHRNLSSVLASLGMRQEEWFYP